MWALSAMDLSNASTTSTDNGMVLGGGDIVSAVSDLALNAIAASQEANANNAASATGQNE